MAWITPKTDRTGPEPKTTETDMNRINGNLNVLTGGAFKDNYTNTDIVLMTDWAALIEAVRCWSTAVTNGTDWANFNLIESTMAEAYNGGLVPSNSLYPSETLQPLSE